MPSPCSTERRMPAAPIRILPLRAASRPVQRGPDDARVHASRGQHLGPGEGGQWRRFHWSSTWRSLLRLVKTGVGSALVVPTASAPALGHVQVAGRGAGGRQRTPFLGPGRRSSPRGSRSSTARPDHHRAAATFLQSGQRVLPAIHGHRGRSTSARMPWSWSAWASAACSSCPAVPDSTPSSSRNTR